jgi:hypothetical protein
LIQDLHHSDNAKVNAGLDALNLDLGEDKKKCETFVTAGGWFALVQLLNKYLDKAIGRFPACDLVAEFMVIAKLDLLQLVVWKQLSR